MRPLSTILASQNQQTRGDYGAISQRDKKPTEINVNVQTGGGGSRGLHALTRLEPLIQAG